MLSTSQIKKEARERFAVNRFQAMLAYSVVYMVLVGIAMTGTLLAFATMQLVTGTLGTVLAIVLWWYAVVVLLAFFVMLAPFQYSMAGFYLKSYRAQKADVSAMVDGFSRYNLERGIILHVLRTLLILAFTVLLIVPGIIFALRTSMSVYLLRANPKMKPTEALKTSNKVMKGHCWQYFVLNLSFIGWMLFGIVTLFVGFIWVVPYLNTSKVVFYKRNLQGDTAVYAADTAPIDQAARAPEPQFNFTVDKSGESDQPVEAVQPAEEDLQPEPVYQEAVTPTVESAPFVASPLGDTVELDPLMPAQNDVPETEDFDLTALENFENSARTDDRKFDELAVDVQDLIEGIEPAAPTPKPTPIRRPNAEAESARRENERQRRLEEIKHDREQFVPSSRPTPQKREEPKHVVEPFVAPPRPIPPVRSTPAESHPAPKVVPPPKAASQPTPPKSEPQPTPPKRNDFDEFFGPDKLDIELDE